MSKQVYKFLILGVWVLDIKVWRKQTLGKSEIIYLLVGVSMRVDVITNKL